MPLTQISALDEMISGHRNELGFSITCLCFPCSFVIASGVVKGLFEPKIQIPDLLLCLVFQFRVKEFFPVLKSLCIYY